LSFRIEIIRLASPAGGKTYVPRGAIHPNGGKSAGISFPGLVSLSANSSTARRTHPCPLYPNLYASLGVPEFWRFNGREWTILQLVAGQYKERDGRRPAKGHRSPTFPLVAKADLYGFLQTAIADEVTAELDFRQWVRTQI
jgi:hypothetical protein